MRNANNTIEMIEKWITLSVLTTTFHVDCYQITKLNVAWHGWFHLHCKCFLQGILLDGKKGTHTQTYHYK